MIDFYYSTTPNGHKARPAVMRAYELAKKINVQATVSEELKSIVFGQTAATVAR